MSDGLKIPGFLEAIRTEGGTSLRNKRRARADEGTRRRKMVELTVTRDGRLDTGMPLPPVLNVAPFPPYPAFAGSQIAMADRLEVEKAGRTVVLAYPSDGAWWLEVWSPSSTGYYPLGTRKNLFEIIGQAARLTRTKLVHIENSNGLPLNLIHGLEKVGLRAIVSIHDFVFFCRRPHLVEQPYEEFCNYSREALRCKVCLRDIDPKGRTSQTDYRRVAVQSLHDASYLIFPSVFMQRQYELLFPERKHGQRESVIAPATVRGGSAAGAVSDHPNVAFVGGVYSYRGAALIQPIMDQVRESEPNAIGFVYGDGEDRLFKLLRKAKNLKIQGYYPPGTLPELLARDKISVAVLPSIVPEAYSLVVDECLAAGVPVAAFERGAVGERLSFWQVGELVIPGLGTDGLAAVVVSALNSGQRAPSSVIRTLPQVERVARKYSDLYKSLRTRTD